MFTFLYTPSARANLTITGGAGFGPALTTCSLDSALFVTAPSLFRDSTDKFFEEVEEFEAKLEVDFSSGLEVAAASFNDEVEDCFDDDAEPEDELEAEDDEEIL